MEVTDRTRLFRNCRVLETERGGRGQQQQQQEEEEERGGEGALWGRRPRWGLQTSRGPSRRAPGGAAQVVAGRGLVGPGRGCSREPGRGSGCVAVGGHCPPSPPPTSGGPGQALGWRRVGESGRVFPPPLGQASERYRARPSLANPALAAARPRFPGVCRPAVPACSLGWTGAVEGGFKSVRRNCSARGVRSSSNMVRGARQGPGLDSGIGVGGKVWLSLRPWPSRSPSPGEVPV